MSAEIPKAYEAKNVEQKWYKQWLAKGCFTADPKSNKPGYCIVIPPPNVTGMLHMGHVLGDTIQDILCRRKRMQGFEVLWLPGTDHAGIGTQTAVEKHLRKQKVIRHRDELGREKFVETIWEWKDQYGGIILEQLKKLGCSLDWSRVVFTMDGLDARDPNPKVNYSRLVLKVFVDLYQKGLIYRGKRMINWCPVSRTALSNEEVEMKEVDGHLWHIKYPIVGEAEEWKNGRMETLSSQTSSLPSIHPSHFVVVATTRPETMLGDEAVAVNPNDERYKKLIGKTVLLPLRNKHIPVIADDFVDPKFGTGCVKVTPAHDPNDYQMALRHKLPLTVVIGPDGSMTEEAGEPFAGLDRFDARKAVVKELEEGGLLTKVEPYRHSIGYSERADVPVEPMLSEQWFLKHPQSQRAIEAVENDEVRFLPEHWKKMYRHWMTNIQDWCISRQLWWGHRVPVWYRGDEVYCGLEVPKGDGWKQDPDVLDTWFSSWLWPFATMGWPEKTDTMKKFYPTTDLVTGFDIIFLWVARMIMAGYEFTGEKPFANVYYTGLVRDAIGRKMSKSLGNSPDPLDLIAKYGADGLRFGLMLIAPQGQDILFDEKRCEVGRNFMNKVWNAARFIQMQRATNPPAASLNIHDRKILFEANEAIGEVNAALDGYRFNEAAKELYDFVWSDFCDWYIETSKAAPNLRVLDDVFSIVLRMLHPFAPHITEELWHGMGCGADTIMFETWPTSPLTDAASPELAAQVDSLYDVIRAGRQLRGDYKIEPKRKVRFAVKPNGDEAFFRSSANSIQLLLGAEEVVIDRAYAPQGVTPSTVTAAATIFMVGAVDVETERARLTKELDRIRKDLEHTEAKLNNPSFRDRAPADKVAEQEARKTETQERIAKLESALKALG